jgi:3-oxoacyl-[acyl-carrier protein] reductase
MRAAAHCGSTVASERVNVARFASRVALVTGAGDGIGRAAALLLAREGARVVLADVDAARLGCSAQLVADAGADGLPIVADVLDAAAVDDLVSRALDRFGGIDVLVNAVGGSTIIDRPDAPIDALSLADWEAVLAFNLRGTFLCTRAVIPAMKRGGGGAVVNLSSIVARGDHAARRTSAPYVVAKSGVRALTRKLARELGPFGIRCNAAAPGVTLTDRMRALIATRSEEDRTAMIADVPLRRFATPDDVARVIAFLASDDAAFVTGQTIEVTGGQ